MSIGTEKRPDRVKRSHWERLATDAEVGIKTIVGIGMELGKALPPAAEKLAARFWAPHGEIKTISAIVTYCSSMSDRLIASLRSATTA